MACFFWTNHVLKFHDLFQQLSPNSGLFLASNNQKTNFRTFRESSGPVGTLSFVTMLLVNKHNWTICTSMLSNFQATFTKLLPKDSKHCKLHSPSLHYSNFAVHVPQKKVMQPQYSNVADIVLYRKTGARNTSNHQSSNYCHLR